MGFDQIFVDIAENYYLSGEAVWADSTFLAKIEEYYVFLIGKERKKVSIALYSPFK